MRSLENETVSTGKVDGNTYSNKFLGFKMELPEGHDLMSDTELKMVNEDVDDFGSGASKEEVEESLKRTKQIFGFRYYDPTQLTMITVNPTLLITTERIDPRMKGLTSKEYLKVARKNHNKMNPLQQFEFEETATVRIGGQLFERQVITQSLYGMEVKTGQYCKIIDDYAVLFSIIYETAEDKQKLINVLSTYENI
tara:strand:- start:144349 stop:144936 length:588 start_codon:yes stop_codon:yes gene_type:complete